MKTAVHRRKRGVPPPPGPAVPVAVDLQRQSVGPRSPWLTAKHRAHASVQQTPPPASRHPRDPAGVLHCTAVVLLHVRLPIQRSVSGSSGPWVWVAYSVRPVANTRLPVPLWQPVEKSEGQLTNCPLRHLSANRRLLRCPMLRALCTGILHRTRCARDAPGLVRVLAVYLPDPGLCVSALASAVRGMTRCAVPALVGRRSPRVFSHFLRASRT